MKIQGKFGVTVNTDASFSCQKKVGGYAFYIVCDYFKIQKSGMFRTQPQTPMQAEMMCMANALHTLSMQPDLPAFSWIVINSDCLFAFDRIKLKSADSIGRVVARKLRLVRERTGFPNYQFRHVKAHNGTPDSRSWVNDWCDKEAKKWMRLAASKITTS